MNAASRPAASRRIAHIDLDESSVARRAPHLDRDRRVAMADLLHENHFRPRDHEGGPYDVRLAMQENRLSITISDGEGAHVGLVLLSLTPLRGVIRDYATVCDSYYEALTTSPSRVEAIDIGRRSLHDEGAELLRQRLEGKIEIDFETARRLFTLICALRTRG